MPGSRVAIALLLCVSALQAPDCAHAQDVKSTYDKAADFKKYKKYRWGSNYLLTQQRPEVQAQINLAIVDSISRDLQGRGLVEDETNPDFVINYEAGGLPKADVGAQRDLNPADWVNWSWGNLGGITSDVWVYSLAKMQITVTDAVTGSKLWQAIASDEIREPTKFRRSLR